MNDKDQEYVLHLRSAINKERGADARETLTKVFGRMTLYHQLGTGRFQRRFAHLPFSSVEEASQSLEAVERICVKHEDKVNAQRRRESQPYPALLDNALRKVIESKGKLTAEVSDALNVASVKETAFDSGDIASQLLKRVSKKPDGPNDAENIRGDAVAYLAELETDLADGVYKK